MGRGQRPLTKNLAVPAYNQQFLYNEVVDEERNLRSSWQTTNTGDHRDTVSLSWQADYLKLFFHAARRIPLASDQECLEFAGYDDIEMFNVWLTSQLMSYTPDRSFIWEESDEDTSVLRGNNMGVLRGKQIALAPVGDQFPPASWELHVQPYTLKRKQGRRKWLPDYTQMITHGTLYGALLALNNVQQVWRDAPDIHQNTPWDAIHTPLTNKYLQSTSHFQRVHNPLAPTNQESLQETLLGRRHRQQ